MDVGLVYGIWSRCKTIEESGLSFTLNKSSLDSLSQRVLVDDLSQSGPKRAQPFICSFSSRTPCDQYGQYLRLQFSYLMCPEVYVSEVAR